MSITVEQRSFIKSSHGIHSLYRGKGRSFSRPRRILRIVPPDIRIFGYAVKRTIKNFAIGHRNWLFSKNIKGAEARATVYSITATILLNGLKPYDYVAYILERMKDLFTFLSKEGLF